MKFNAHFRDLLFFSYSLHSLWKLVNCHTTFIRDDTIFLHIHAKDCKKARVDDYCRPRATLRHFVSFCHKSQYRWPAFFAIFLSAVSPIRGPRKYTKIRVYLFAYSRFKNIIKHKTELTVILLSCTVLPHYLRFHILL